MKHLLIGIAAAMATAVLSPAWAQYPGPPPSPYADLDSWRFVAPTPEDAYRDHQINRWQLEQLTGPLPQALQGPSPNGDSPFGR
jgi:hypothetical protein